MVVGSRVAQDTSKLLVAMMQSSDISIVGLFETASSD